MVFRPFGAADAVETGRRLAKAAHARGLIILAGADPRLAAAIGADGVHLPERLAAKARGLRRSRPGWIITAAAHSRRAVQRAHRAGADAVFVSPVFETASPSAWPPLGPLRFAALVRGSPLPVFALGGLNPKTARRIARSGAAGLAAIEALAEDKART